MKIPKILKNKYISYSLIVLALLNIIGYITINSTECVIIFIITGYSIYLYCKNISCAIISALFVSNFLFSCNNIKEGLWTKKSYVDLQAIHDKNKTDKNKTDKNNKPGAIGRALCNELKFHSELQFYKTPQGWAFGRVEDSIEIKKQKCLKAYKTKKYITNCSWIEKKKEASCSTGDLKSNKKGCKDWNATFTAAEQKGKCY